MPPKDILTMIWFYCTPILLLWLCIVATAGFWMLIRFYNMVHEVLHPRTHPIHKE